MCETPTGLECSKSLGKVRSLQTVSKRDFLEPFGRGWLTFLEILFLNANDTAAVRYAVLSPVVSHRGGVEGDFLSSRNGGVLRRGLPEGTLKAETCPC